jgi:hypothetical protein
MSVVLSSITEQITEAEVELGEATVKFTYKPYAVTLGMAMQLSEGGIEMIAILVDVLDSWDITMEKGKKFPITEENLLLIPIDLAKAIAEKIVGEGEKETGEAVASSFAS